MHLHGHDMYVLGTGNGDYSTASTLNFENPTRRDLATMPAGGWMVVAFVTDNPGAWLMHWHVLLNLPSSSPPSLPLFPAHRSLPISPLAPPFPLLSAQRGSMRM